MRTAHRVSGALVAAFVLVTASGAFAADGDDWVVSKSSGEVWFNASGVQQASLKQEDILKAGDSIRTGRTGRVLLKRGAETMLVAPNSVVGLPATKKEGLSTTIVQQAGSILLDVEKRNVQHFEVETPYLAAVVKGTQFRVTIKSGSTSVDVIRGQVQVADLKSGQIAQVMPGQHATVFADGKTGLSLGGSGMLTPIEQGTPRAPSIERVPVPRAGLSAQRNASRGQSAQTLRQASLQPAKHGVTRISAAIGEVKLNIHRATQGLVRDKSASVGASRNSNSPGLGTVADSGHGNVANVSGSNAGSAASTGNASASNISSAVAAVSGAGGGGNNGNGHAGNNKNSNGYAYGNGNGNGNGNGHAYGHSKK
jgi:hypothetical protein